MREMSHLAQAYHRAKDRLRGTHRITPFTFFSLAGSWPCAARVLRCEGPTAFRSILAHSCKQAKAQTFSAIVAMGRREMSSLVSGSLDG